MSLIKSIDYQHLVVAIEASFLKKNPLNSDLLSLPINWLVAGEMIEQQFNMSQMLPLLPDLDIESLKRFLRSSDILKIPLSDYVVEGFYQVQDIEKSRVLMTRIARFAPHTDFVVMGLMELMINAIEHGNLGISFDEKSILNQKGMWMKEVQDRLQQKPFKDLFVQVQYAKQEDKIVYTITDRGKGFDLSKVRRDDLPNPKLFHGRGIIMAKEIAFNSLSYVEPGNQVKAEVFFR